MGYSKKSFLRSAYLVISALTSSAFAQSYPYDNAPIDSDNAAALPVEVPTPTTPSGAPSRVPQRPTSLFRMALKGGGNFTSFQDRLCVSASGVGCLTYLDRSYSGFGFQGHISFGWDLAYQPVFLETEIGYLHKMLNQDSPLRVLQIQQGLFHRKRIGQKTLWKNGVLAALDVRIAEVADTDLEAAAFPAIGLASAIEWGSFMTQLNIHLSQIRSSRNHWSSSLLMGVRF